MRRPDRPSNTGNRAAAGNRGRFLSVTFLGKIKKGNQLPVCHRRFWFRLRANGKLIPISTSLAFDGRMRIFHKLLNPMTITIALSKGRIFDETLPLLAAAGITPLEDPESSRKLILPTNRADVRLIIVRASDVPTYVQYGSADLGVAGKDVLNEHGGTGLYQPLDLNIARCRMMVAVRDDFDYDSAVRQGARLRVATKYTQAAREHFAAKGVYVDLIKLYGSMELAPLVGLADAIVDLVSTGNTLKANDLVAVEDIMPISSRLVVNRAALKTRHAQLQPLLDAFEQASHATVAT